MRNQDLLHDSLRNLAAEVARTARREKLSGKGVTLKVRYQGFETYTRQLTLAAPTQDEKQLLDTGWRLFNDGTLPNKAVRLIGIGMSGWEGETTPLESQADMFGEASANSSADTQSTDPKILATMDKLYDKYGKPLLKVGLNKGIKKGS